MAVGVRRPSRLLPRHHPRQGARPSRRPPFAGQPAPSILREMHRTSRQPPRSDGRVVAALRKASRKVREVGAFYAFALAARRALPPRALYAGRTIMLELRPDRDTMTLDDRE